MSYAAYRRQILTDAVITGDFTRVIDEVGFELDHMFVRHYIPAGVKS